MCRRIVKCQRKFLKTEKQPYFHNLGFYNFLYQLWCATSSERLRTVRVWKIKYKIIKFIYVNFQGTQSRYGLKHRYYGTQVENPDLQFESLVYSRGAQLNYLCGPQLFLHIEGCFYERNKLNKQEFGRHGPDLKLLRAICCV